MELKLETLLNYLEPREPKQLVFVLPHRWWVHLRGLKRLTDDEFEALVQERPYSVLHGDLPSVPRGTVLLVAGRLPFTPAQQAG